MSANTTHDAPKPRTGQTRWETTLLAEKDKEIARLRAENARLRKALRFYADAHWPDDYPGGCFGYEDTRIIDTGDVARAALKGETDG